MKRRTANRSSVFWNLLLSSVIPASCSILILCIVFLMIFSRTARKVDNSYEQVMAYTVATHMDGLHETGEDIRNRLGQSDLFHDVFISHCLSENRLTALERQDMIKLMTLYAAESSEIELVSFHYHRDADTLFTSAGVFSNVSFFREQYPDKVQYRFFDDAPDGFSTAECAGKTYLLYSAEVTDVPGGSMKARINILFHEKTVLQRIRKSTEGNVAAIHILSGSGEALWSGSILTESAKTVAFRTASNQTDAEYVLDVPNRIHSSTRNHILPLLLLTIVADVAACIILAVHFLRINYRPIMRTVSKYIENYTPDMNEFDALNQVMNQTIQDKAEAQDALKELFPVARQRVVYSILDGTAFLHTEMLSDHYERYGISFPYGFYNVIAVSVPLSERLKTMLGHELSMQSAMLTMDTVCEQAANGLSLHAYLYSQEIDRYLILLNYSDAKDLDAFTRALFDLCHQENLPASDARVTIGIGSQTEKVSDVHNSGDDACVALNYAAITPEQSIVRYEDIHRQNASEFFYPFSKELLLSRAVSDGDLEAAQRILTEVLEENRSHAAPHALSLLFSSLQSTIVRTLQSLSIPIDIPLHISNPTLQDIYSCIGNMLECACAKLQERRVRNVESEEDSIIAYIKENLYNPDMSLNQTAEHFGRSPALISAIFKNRMHVKYIDYVNQKRIERAVQLICQEHKEINEVYQEVGYVSLSTFRRNYAKYTKGLPLDESQSKDPS